VLVDLYTYKCAACFVSTSLTVVGDMPCCTWSARSQFLITLLHVHSRDYLCCLRFVYIQTALSLAQYSSALVLLSRLLASPAVPDGALTDRQAVTLHTGKHSSSSSSSNSASVTAAAVPEAVQRQVNQCIVKPFPSQYQHSSVFFLVHSGAVAPSVCQ
jgi:hypothetical protein